MSQLEDRYGGLGYVGVGAPDPAAWVDFATGICGLMPAPILPGPGPIRVPSPERRGVAEDGTAYLKMDDRQWRLAIHPRPEPGLEYVGFELKSKAAFTRTLEELDAGGAKWRAGSAEECEARGVAELAVLADPAGHRVELFRAPLRDRGFQSAQGTTFLTGGLGMGHVVLYVADVEAALDFYRGTLGFERSDYMHFGPDGMGIHFLRCTARHHSIALLQVGPPSGVQHLMFEMTTLDQVGMALDRALAAKIPITSGLGRHRNDETVSFYMQGPSGFDIEIGWDGLLVDDTWVENEFGGGGDLWGHHGLTAEAMQSKDDS